MTFFTVDLSGFVPLELSQDFATFGLGIGRGVEGEGVSLTSGKAFVVSYEPF
jgi:hypothetical protein